MPQSSTRKQRHQAILGLIRKHRIQSQEELRRLLAAQGFDVTQATLSRDLRNLRVAKLPHAEGDSYYAAPDPETAAPELEQLLPHLMTSCEGVGNLVVVKTLAGGAQAVAESIDLEGWPEVLGTIAGDDTILVIVRETEHAPEILSRLEGIAGRS